MDSHEFQRLLLLFPVVRSRDYSQSDAQSSRQAATSSAPQTEAEQHPKSQDAFWGELQSAAEQKVGPAGAEKLCDAFQNIYHKSVYEELSKDVAQNYVNSMS